MEGGSPVSGTVRYPPDSGVSGESLPVPVTTLGGECLTGVGGWVFPGGPPSEQFRGPCDPTGRVPQG